MAGEGEMCAGRVLAVGGLCYYFQEVFTGKRSLQCVEIV
jgi:hypothetical protein